MNARDFLECCTLDNNDGMVNGFLVNHQSVPYCCWSFNCFYSIEPLHYKGSPSFQKWMNFRKISERPLNVKCTLYINMLEYIANLARRRIPPHPKIHSMYIHSYIKMYSMFICMMYYYTEIGYSKE